MRVIDAESRFSESTQCAGGSQALTEGFLADRSLLDGADRSSARFSGQLAKAGLLLVAALALTVLFAGNANAAYNHVAGPTFEVTTMTNVTAGQIAIDESTGDVYVLGQGGGGGGTGDIEKFTSAGVPSNFSSLGTNVINTTCTSQCLQIAVDNTGGPNQGTIYLSTTGSQTTCCNPEGPNFQSGGIMVFSPAGIQIDQIFERSQFEYDVRSCGVAVDQNGDLLVMHGEGQTNFTYLDKLDIESWSSNPEQVPPVVGTIGGDFSQPCKINENSFGRIYAQSGESPTSTGQVRYWNPDEFGTPDTIGLQVPESLKRTSTQVDPGPGLGFALDGDDNVYVNRTSSPTRIRKFDPDNSLVETFGSGELLQPSGIAVNKSTGVIYAADRSTNVAAKDVHIFNPVLVPDSLTGAFSATDHTEGVLDAEVDPVGGGEIETCKFQYVLQTTFNSSEFGSATDVPCVPGAPLNAATEVEAPITGLTLEQPYKFRVVSSNSNGASNGTVRTFIPHAVINLNTEPATEVEPRTATVNASFTGDGDDTEVFFEYGPTIGYGKTSDADVVTAPTGAQSVSIPLDELELETTYHVRVVAENATGKSTAQDVTFTTPPAVPGVKTNTATPITQDGITLNGEFNGNGMNTKYFFEYGVDTSYGMLSDEVPVDAGSPTGLTPVSSMIENYEGYTTYHYRLVTENSLGTTYGKDQTFTTLDSPLPEIQGTEVSEITSTSAFLSGEVNPNRWATVYLFEWGPTTDYGASTTLENVIEGEGNDFQSVSAPIADLEPGTLYHYRLVAINLTGVTNGPDQTFATPSVPGIETAVASAITETTAHLSTRVLANGSPTSVRFEYGPSLGYGSTTALTPIGADVIAHEVAADLSGLAPGTTYHMRVVAENAIGVTNSSDVDFTTIAAPVERKPETKPIKCKKGFKKVKVKGKTKCKKIKKKHKKKHKKNKGKRNG
jgi:hypothetical protein